MASKRSRPGLTIAETIVLAVLGLAIVGGGYKVAHYMMTHRPRPSRTTPKQEPPTVRVEKIYPSDHQILLDVKGTVIPAVEIELKPRISGEIIEVHPEFIEGGLVKTSETLLKIDPSDYELALIGAESRRETARYELALEEGQQDIAQREWELMGVEDGATTLDRELALRRPHLREKEAKLRAAEADVAQAKLNLSRTEIRAPFNAIVRSADVKLGDQATPQTVLGRLVGTDAYWVRTSIPTDQIRWIHVPNGDDVVTTAEIQIGTGAAREGRVLKLLSDLEPVGRMARLLVQIDDPLDLCSAGESRKPVLLGEYVRVEIQGRTIEDVFVVPRYAVRENRELWLLDDDDKLHIQNASVIWKDTDNAVLTDVAPGSRLIVSDLAAPVEGRELQLVGAPAQVQEADGTTSGPVGEPVPGMEADSLREEGAQKPVPGGEGSRKPAGQDQEQSS